MGFLGPGAGQARGFFSQLISLNVVAPNNCLDVLVETIAMSSIERFFGAHED